MILEEFCKTKRIKSRTKRCLMNESYYCYKGSIGIIKNYWKDSTTIKDFIKKVLNDDRLINNQGYWELAKEQPDYIQRLENYLDKISDTILQTSSDGGAVKIGNDSFSYNIFNLAGDGENLVYIINKNLDLQCMDFKDSFACKEAYVYCSDISYYDYYDICLKGCYAIYVAPRHIALVKRR